MWIREKLRIASNQLNVLNMLRSSILQKNPGGIAFFESRKRNMMNRKYIQSLKPLSTSYLVIDFFWNRTSSVSSIYNLTLRRYEKQEWINFEGFEKKLIHLYLIEPKACLVRDLFSKCLLQMVVLESPTLKFQRIPLYGKLRINSTSSDVISGTRPPSPPNLKFTPSTTACKGHRVVHCPLQSSRIL